MPYFSEPVLMADETIVKSWLANRDQRGRAVGGKLYLTTSKLAFIPSALEAKLGGGQWEAPLTAIVSAEKAPRAPASIFAGGIRERLRVVIDARNDDSTSDYSTQELFVVNNVDDVASDILTTHAPSSVN